MISFDTDGLRPHERFDHWCEVRAKGLFGVTIEVEPERRPDFYGRFSAREFGGAVVAEMNASSYSVSRTWADIKRMPGDGLYISQQVRGPGALHTGNGRVHMVSNGTLVISHSDLPCSGIPQRSDGFHFRAIKIPVAGNELLAAGAKPARRAASATKPYDDADRSLFRRDRCAASGACWRRCRHSPYRATGPAGARPRCGRFA